MYFMNLIDWMEAAGTINDDLFQLIQIAAMKQDGDL